MFKIQDVTLIYIKVIHDIFSLIEASPASFKNVAFVAGLSENIENDQILPHNASFQI